MKYYQLTLPDARFSNEIAEQINRKYPDQAKVVDGKCLITEKYWAYCKHYVQKNCNIKQIEREDKNVS